MSDNNIHVLPSNPTDSEKAADYKDRIRQALAPVCAILNEAQAEGIQVTFNCGRDAFGRNVVGAVEAVKPL